MVQDEKWDFYNSSRLVELTYPLKLLESQGKKLLGDYLERSVRERTSEKKEEPRRRRKRWGNREDGDTPAFIHVALRTARRISVYPSKLGYSPVVRDIRRFAKLGFHALFHNLNYRHGVVKIGLARRVMLCTIYSAQLAIGYTGLNKINEW